MKENKNLIYIDYKEKEKLLEYFTKDNYKKNDERENFKWKWGIDAAKIIIGTAIPYTAAALNYIDSKLWKKKINKLIEMYKNLIDENENIFSSSLYENILKEYSRSCFFEKINEEELDNLFNYLIKNKDFSHIEKEEIVKWISLITSNDWIKTKEIFFSNYLNEIKEIVKIYKAKNIKIIDFDYKNNKIEEVKIISDNELQIEKIKETIYSNIADTWDNEKFFKKTRLNVKKSIENWNFLLSVKTFEEKINFARQMSGKIKNFHDYSFQLSPTIMGVFLIGFFFLRDKNFIEKLFNNP